MLDALTDLVSGSPWTYALVAGVVAADAIVPLIPGETVVIAAAILAAEGDLSLALVVAAAVAGCFAGDNASWAVGGGVGERAVHRLFRADRGRDLLSWAQRQLHGRGGWVIVPARFVPGGRTATTFTAGATALRWRVFVKVDAAAAVLWGVYATALGYLGGTTFRDEAWKAVAASLALAALAATLGELVRRRSMAPGPAPPCRPPH
jgi:membrane-associated protein